MKLTSKTWNKINKYIFGIVIFDPDGWDRKNYDYSFNKEKITWKEFCERTSASTCLFQKRFHYYIRITIKVVKVIEKIEKVLNSLKDFLRRKLNVKK